VVRIGSSEAGREGGLSARNRTASGNFECRCFATTLDVSEGRTRSWCRDVLATGSKGEFEASHVHLHGRLRLGPASSSEKRAEWPRDHILCLRKGFFPFQTQPTQHLEFDKLQILLFLLLLRASFSITKSTTYISRLACFRIELHCMVCF
jgi:hypothetical protein